MTWSLAAIAALALAVAGFYAAAWLRGWRIGRLSWPFQSDVGARAGGCRRCETAYTFTTPHVLPVDYLPNGNRMALTTICERCWIELGDGEQRYGFYADALVERLRAAESREDDAAVASIRRIGVNAQAALRAGL